MFRIPNTDLLNAEKALVDLIGNFRLISYEQMITYHILKEKAANKAQVLSKMRHLAVKYHFSCFEEKKVYAFYKTDLELSYGYALMWIYLDFLSMGIAGSVLSSNIPHTPIVFEQTDEAELIELVCVPDSKEEIVLMNQDLFLYDGSLEEEVPRRRILVLKREEDLSFVKVKHGYIAAIVNDDRIEYVPYGKGEEYAQNKPIL